MSLITLLFICVIFLLTKDDDVKLMMLISGCMFFSEYLFWLSGSQFYYFRHIVLNVLLAIVCFKFNRTDFRWAGIICLMYSSVFLFEFFHEYKSPIYHYIPTIQIVMMQLYLLALTYKSEWKLPCLRQQRM
jgi:hypothetical protein